MNLELDNGHLILFLTNVVSLLIGMIYHLGVMGKYEAKVEKLLDRLMSRSITEFKRVQMPKRVLPQNKSPMNDAELAIWEERARRDQEEGMDAVKADIADKLDRVREATARAGVK